MIDYFSEQFSALYIRGAVVFAVLVGIVEIVLAVRAPELVSQWAIPEGLLVLALAYGVWKRSFAAAISLFAVKTIGAIVWSYQSGRPPTRTAIIQLVSYGLAAAAISFGRSTQHRRASDAQPNASDGGAK